MSDMFDFLNKLLKSSSRNTRLNQIIDKCIQGLKANPSSIELLQQLAETHNLLGQYSKAIRSCNEILKLNQNDKSALNNLFFAIDRIENFDQALSILKNYLELFPLNKNKKFQQLSYISGLKDYFKKGKEIPFLEPNLPSHYPSIVIDINFNTTFRFSKIGWSSRGIEVLKIILKRYPFDVESWNALGIRYFSLERYEEAKNILNKALEIDPKNVFTHLLLGQMHLKGKEFEKAKKEFTFVIQEQKLDQVQILANHTSTLTEDSDDNFERIGLGVAAWSGLGETYNEVGEYEDAIEACNKSIILYQQLFSFVKKPEIAPIYKNLGIAYHALGNNKESLKAFKKALKHDPESVEVLECMGDLYLEMKKFKYAIEIFQHIVGIKPVDYLAWHLLSKSYLKSGKISYVSEANTRCLKLNPNFKPALELRKKIS